MNPYATQVFCEFVQTCAERIVRYFITGVHRIATKLGPYSTAK